MRKRIIPKGLTKYDVNLRRFIGQPDLHLGCVYALNSKNAFKHFYREFPGYDDKDHYDVSIVWVRDIDSNRVGLAISIYEHFDFTEEITPEHIDFEDKTLLDFIREK